MTGLTIKFSFKLIDLQPRMLSKNRSDSKEMGNKLLNNNIFVRKFPEAVLGEGFCFAGKPYIGMVQNVCSQGSISKK